MTRTRISKHVDARRPSTSSSCSSLQTEERSGRDDGTEIGTRTFEGVCGPLVVLSASLDAPLSEAPELGASSLNLDSGDLSGDMGVAGAADDKDDEARAMAGAVPLVVSVGGGIRVCGAGLVADADAEGVMGWGVGGCGRLVAPYIASARGG
jgi:hypothetical protein